MIYRSYRLSSSQQALESECDKLRSVFSKLCYPNNLINYIFSSFTKNLDTNDANNAISNNSQSVRIVLPFKDQASAGFVRHQLKSHSNNIGINIQAIFKSRSIQDIFQPKENKPAIVRNQSVVYYFKCDQCEADYVGYTRRHLHQRIAEHKYSAVGKHIAKNHKNCSYRDAEKNFQS